MKYLHYYQTDSEFQPVYDGSGYTEPWVSLVEETDRVNYNKKLLTFEILSDGTVGCTANLSLEYKLNDGEWLPFNSGTSVNVVTGDKVKFRGNQTRTGGIFRTTARFNLSGNIMSLIDDLQSFPSDTTENFVMLFNGCTNLISAKNLILPADVLTYGCYGFMFAGCTNLIEAPKLPATQLADHCYAQMFSSCTSLRKAPDLLARTTVARAYIQMFLYCSNLNYIKCLGNQGDGTATGNWVNGVNTTNGTFVKASGVNWDTGESGIPDGWTVLEV